MQFILVSMYDEKTHQYLAPQCESNGDTAVRNFRYAVSTSDNMRFIVDDLRLYKIGVFDTDTGAIVSTAVPELIIDGKDVVLDD